MIGDDAFLEVVRDWARGEEGCDEARFEQLALATCAEQLARNAPYARYARERGFDAANPPRHWRDIPAVPASAFKDATLATFDVAGAELEFHTSGTTARHSGKHYIQRAALYDAALLAAFDRFMLPDRPTLRYLNLVPDPRFAPHSSLGYMVGHVSVLRGDGGAAYFADGETLDVTGFTRALDAAIAQAHPVCVTGTAFAFVALLDALLEGHRTFAAPPRSRIMETGGFKGRTRTLERSELYERLEAALGVPQTSIVAEYGMTELTSQYYDSLESRAGAVRVKAAAPWLHTLVVDDAGNEVPFGETGLLLHVDLGNRSSVLAVATEDRGYAVHGGIVLLGRPLAAPPRGCSLAAEELTVPTAV